MAKQTGEATPLQALEHDDFCLQQQYVGEILRSLRLFVCSSVCPLVSQKHKFSVQVTVQWLCHLLSTVQYDMYSTSGFVDDVIFSHSVDSGPILSMTLCFFEFARWQQRRRNGCVRMQAWL